MRGRSGTWMAVLVLCALWAHDAAGQSTIVGSAGNDVIRPVALGGSNNGLPAATDGDDAIDGRAGDDEITPGPGSDTVAGGDGDDTIFVFDGDAAAEEFLFGNGGFNRLVLVGSGPFDLTNWTIVDVQGLTLATGGTVRLRPDQLLGFTDIAGLGGTLELTEPPVGTSGIYPLLSRIGTGIAPLTTIAGSGGDDVVSLPGAPGSPIAFNGGTGHDTAVLPGAVGDYAPLSGAPFPPITPTAVRDASTGALLYTLADVEAVLFAADLPSVQAQPDQVEATIGHAGSFAPGLLLGNDQGYGLSIAHPGPGRDVPTSAGGRLSSPGAGMPLTYSPPAEIIPFGDQVAYTIEDVLGNVATAILYLNVANQAPSAPNRSYIRLAGGVIRVEDLLAGVTDPDGGNVTFGTFSFEVATGFAEPVYEPGTTTLVGYRVFEGATTPGVGRFLYTLRDDSGAIGSSDQGEVTVTFVPLEAGNDALRGTMPSSDGAVHGEVIWTDALLANDAPGAVFEQLIGATEVAPGTFLLTVFDPVTGRHVATVYYETAALDSRHIRYYAEEAGVFTFSYGVSDGAGGTAIGTVTVTVDNHAPVATPQIIPVSAGATVTVPLRDLAFGGVHGPANSDADGDPIVFSCYALLPAGDPRGTLQGFGPANPNDPTDFGGVAFTPAPGFTGDVTLNYCIKDRPDLGGAERNTFSNSTFTFRVGAPPVVEVGMSVTGPIIESTGGVPGYARFYFRRSGGDLSQPTVVHWTLGPNAASSQPGQSSDFVGGFRSGAFVLTGTSQLFYPLDLVVADDNVHEPTESFRFTVTGYDNGQPLAPTEFPYFNFFVYDDDPAPNTPPVGVNDSVSTAYETPVVIAVIANDTDAENDPLGAGAFADLVGGTLSLPGDGTVLFTPTPGFTGSGGFTYRPYDGQVQGNVTTVTVTVGGPPPPPCAADVSGRVTVMRGPVRYVSARARFEQVVTLTNPSWNAPVAGPLVLALGGLGAHARLANADGVTSCAAPAGAPFRLVPLGGTGTLNPLENVTIVLAFTTTQNQAITYTTRVLAGTTR